MEFDIAAPEELIRVSDFLVKHYKDITVWLFRGEMGAGKTTLIKQVCTDLDVIDIVNSPTFSIVNEYLTENDESIYHFDFYRIENEHEAVDIGTEEYFYSGQLCLVEWAEKIPSLIPPEYIESNINLQDSLNRKITVKKHG
ncbi:MAG: tRNA (adenosine(37)-N6)-threonylcarbamoyltransferase complex ATPase subunit type 1 TsaE [Cyclobacteriaceae bacterium]